MLLPCKLFYVSALHMHHGTPLHKCPGTSPLLSGSNTAWTLSHLQTSTYATQWGPSKQEVIELDPFTIMEAFTNFASSQGLRLKELTVPAAATPDEVLRRFYIMLDLAEKDKGLLFYSYDNRVCGMCSWALPDIPGLSCSDMNVIKMAMAPNNEDRAMVTWVHNDGYMAGRTGQDLPGFRKWLTTTSMSSLPCCVCYEPNCRSRGG